MYMNMETYERVASPPCPRSTLKLARSEERPQRVEDIHP